ncbi:MAG: hypothetical protein WCG80_19270 [Spirochaetales bacterium]
MASLKYDQLELRFEYRYVSYWENGNIFRIGYEVAFLWDGQSLINPQVMNDETPGSEIRELGGFLPVAFEEEGMIDLLEQVLTAGRGGVWEPLILPAIEVTVRDHRDYFLIDVFACSAAFKGFDTYSGNGVALRLEVDRPELEQFLADLKAEYAQLLKEAG